MTHSQLREEINELIISIADGLSYDYASKEIMTAIDKYLHQKQSIGMGIKQNS